MPDRPTGRLIRRSKRNARPRARRCNNPYPGHLPLTATLGFGAGAYAAIHHGEHPDERPTADGIVSGIVSVSASYRFTQHWGRA
ncbi:hypothetical protein [Paraburkholderia sp. PGU19]|uniref:hypothetical protein n=1 Tax=Paraburkholderia sp. PGU19 TaxID=2735434 RepID=UPI001FB0B75B|nr:hypothetical protein [Paraburkholderia sp. PGU19]